MLGVRCAGFQIDSCSGQISKNIALQSSEIHKELSVIPNTRSDLVLINSSNPIVILEVVNTHKLDAETKELYQRSKIPVCIKNLTWDNLHELSTKFIADESLNVESQTLCTQCVHRKESFESECKKRKQEQKLRRQIIDSAVERLARIKYRKPQFQPWYKVKRDNWRREIRMYQNIQLLVFANAIILTELGFKQHNPRKPWLFRFRIHKSGKYIYADLGGSEDDPIYKNTSAMLYTCLEEDNEVREYAVKRFSESLRSHEVAVRFGSTGRNVNPMKHVDRTMLNSLVKWVEKPEKVQTVQNPSYDEDKEHWRATYPERMERSFQKHPSEKENEPQRPQDENSEAWRRLNKSLRKAKEEHESNQSESPT